MVAKSL